MSSPLLQIGWAKKGFRVVSEERELERRAICTGCEHGDAEAHLKLGMCKKCGCSWGKLWLADWECPLPEGQKKFLKEP